MNRRPKEMDVLRTTKEHPTFENKKIKMMDDPAYPGRGVQSGQHKQILHT